MAFDSYAGLVAEIAVELDRDDLEDRIPSWIRLAEAEMQRVLRAYSTRISNYAVPLATTGLTGNVPGLAGVTSIEFVGIKGLEDTVPSPLTLVSESALLQAHRDTPTTGRPDRYAIVGQAIMVYPLPDGADGDYSAVLTMVGPTLSFAVPLTEANAASNPLLSEHPDLYFYGALVHSAPFLKDDARTATWQGFFDKAVKQIDIQHDRLAHFAGGAKRAVLPRVFG